MLLYGKPSFFLIHFYIPRSFSFGIKPSCYDIIFNGMPLRTIWVNEDRVEPCVFLRSGESVRLWKGVDGVPEVYP